MKPLWPINAEAKQKVVIVKELAPFVIEENAIGLECVLNMHSWPLIFLLKLYRAPEEVKTHERRLSPLPGHSDLRDLVRFKELSDVCLMHLIRHAKIAAWIKALFFQEEAVGAVQVAGRTRRLGHDVKCSGGLIQCHLIDMNAQCH
jgi:hypothetical protein